MNFSRIIKIGALLAPAMLFVSANAGAQTAPVAPTAWGSCVLCHSTGNPLVGGPLGANPLWKGNGTAPNITAMIANIGPMKNITLTTADLNALVAYFANFTTDPAGGDTAKMAAYGLVAANGSAAINAMIPSTYAPPGGMCVSCHSRGIPSDSIAGAISETNSMHFLANIGSGTIGWLNAARSAGITRPSTTPVPTRTPTPTPTTSPSRTPTPTAGPSRTPTPTPEVEPTPTRTPTATPSPTRVPTATPRPRPTRPHRSDD